ncbi:MAG: DinB family protein [Balneolaceae bacterium]
MKHPAIQQYHYHKWANDRVFEHLKSLPAELFDNEIKSVFSSIREVFVHMYQVDGMWLSVMAGDELSKTMAVIKELNEKSKGRDLDETRQLFEELNRQYETFLGEHEDLDKEITIKHPHFGEMSTLVSELVKHVVNHGTYHRGNISAMLRQQGYKGVPTDYIFYLYETP